MAIRRLRLEYTVYPPNYSSETDISREFKTFARAKAAAHSIGTGAEIWRAVQQTNKRGEQPGTWWDIAMFLMSDAGLKKIPKQDWHKYKKVT